MNSFYGMRLKGWQPTKKSNKPIPVSVLFGQIRKKLHHLPDESLSSIWSLLSYISGQNRVTLAGHPETELSVSHVEQIEFLVDKLISGIPLAYLIESQAFFNLDFYINQNVLIPRPETELLVEQASHWLKNIPFNCTVADVGTGSGCIAVTLANSIPNINIVATDISFIALEVAERNILRYALQDRITLIQSDLLNGIQQRFDLICANLPYIPTEKLHTLSISQYEPRNALDGGIQGLAHINRMLIDAPRWLSKPGLLLMEIDSSQEISVSQLAHRIFPHSIINVLNDLAGHPRLLRIEQYSI